MKNNHAFLNVLKSQRKNNGINTVKNGLFCAVVNKICGFIKIVTIKFNTSINAKNNIKSLVRLVLSLPAVIKFKSFKPNLFDCKFCLALMICGYFLSLYTKKYKNTKIPITSPISESGYIINLGSFKLVLNDLLYHKFQKGF